MRKNMRNQGIAGIILISLLIIAGGMLYGKLFYNTFLKNVLSTLEETSNKNAASFGREVSKGKELLINIGLIIEQKESLDVDQVISDLKAVGENNSFIRMGIITKDGNAYTTDAQCMYLGDRDYFMRSLNDNETVMSDTLADRIGEEKINVYSTPVTFQDGTRCVLFATQFTSVFAKSLPDGILEQAGYSCLVNQNGNFVAGNSAAGEFKEADTIYSALNEMSEKNQKISDQLRINIALGNKGYIEFNDDSGYYMYYQPVKINDWYLLTVIPGDVIRHNMESLLGLAYLFLVVCMGAIILLLLLLGRMRQIGRKELEKIAFMDEITQGKNYARFKIEAREFLNNRKEDEYALVCFNLNKFQYINELFGFEEGDKVLGLVNHIIRQSLAENEVSARMMADHFVALMKYDDKKFLKMRVEEIIKKIKSQGGSEGREYEVRAIAGIYQIAKYDTELDIMVDRAKMAMSQNDSKTLEVCSYYDDRLRNRKIQVKEIEDSFDAALINKEFVVYYQAKYDIHRQKYDGAEALVRWLNPVNGMISPGVFIPILENNGRVVQLDEYVFEEVCRQIREWLDEGYVVTPISVNISRLHLYRNDFLSAYLQIVKKYQIPVNLIQLELTETVLLANEKLLKGIIEELHKHGIWVLMDDFGSGYSSLNSLKNIPIDVLKMDKSIIDDSDKDEKSKKIITSVVKLAKELHIQVVAEGVETREQYEFLSSISCDYIQGFYCAKPVSARDYQIFMKKED